MEKTGLVKLTQSAVDHMTKLIDEQGKPIVRLEVKGGGCAGFQYEWSMTENLEEKDEVVIEARKYAIVIAFLAAAFLTPPDPFSQISLALPIIILYEISIFLAKIIQKNKKE